MKKIYNYGVQKNEQSKRYSKLVINKFNSEKFLILTKFL